MSSNAARGGPSGERWLHEIKFDGYRIQAHLQKRQPAIYTRASYDWTLRFQPIAYALAGLGATDLILDGEAVVPDSRGFPDFGLLHADLAAGRQDRLLYYAFDLLYLDGFDLRGAGLAERKRLLSELLADTSERILYAEHLEGDAQRSMSAPAPWASKGSSANSWMRRIAPGGWPRENVLQLLPDAVPPSKEQLAAYWEKVWKRALTHLGRRPLKLVRHVKGTTFYHKGQLPPVPETVHRLTIEKREGGEGTRLWVDDLAGLLGLVEIGAVELHPWNARIDDIERPDMLVFDLDPGDGVAWEFVIDTALGCGRG